MVGGSVASASTYYTEKKSATSVDNITTRTALNKIHTKS